MDLRYNLGCLSYWEFQCSLSNFLIHSFPPFNEVYAHKQPKRQILPTVERTSEKIEKKFPVCVIEIPDLEKFRNPIYFRNTAKTSFSKISFYCNYFLFFPVSEHMLLRITLRLMWNSLLQMHHMSFERSQNWTPFLKFVTFRRSLNALQFLICLQIGWVFSSGSYKPGKVTEGSF